MFNQDKQRAASRSIFMSSVTGLANTLALAVAFLVAPKIYGWSQEWVSAFVTNNYGDGWGSIANLGWGLVTGAGVFFLARASIATALVMGGLALATRFL